MFEELSSASEQLRVALERYLHVCSSIQDIYFQGTIPRNIPREYGTRVDHELSLAESYDMKMQQAKVAIKATRNHAFSIAPINYLPPEILTRIFQMARDIDPSSVDHLAVVCSRWRLVALGSCSLWSHIDYRPDPVKWFYPELLARARLHIFRSGGAPLDVCLAVESEIYNNKCRDEPVQSLCKLVGPRMSSLSLELDGLSWMLTTDRDGGNSVLSTLFSTCTPGILTKLVTKDEERFGFLATKDDHNFETSTLNLDLTAAHLNTIFASITVLHLTGLFPPWISHAYHGLVDLRLCAGCIPDDDEIAEAELVEILKASPGLRIIHFELGIIEWTRRDGQFSVPRVFLPELEVLQVSSGTGLSFSRVENFLRLLKPGQKPLHLSIRHHSSAADTKPHTTETRAFFTRSNITKLHATRFPQMFELLSWLPYLKVMVLSDFICWEQQPSDWYPIHHQSTTRLDTCYLLNCLLPLDDVLALARCYKPRSFVLFGGGFHRDRPDVKLQTRVVKKELSSICSDVKIAKTRPNMEEHRDLFYDH
ncbi:F-box-like domain protein [Rhizoctonia solani 123E]|uniref:F-box-like domain protein n=1 Tax=Rhizoctonia solani 123E TaxID=1423351 RepID=A0A074SHX7_9AGAM|nr:F-box-like domain protein [Rhizoctonia solani 123E]